MDTLFSLIYHGHWLFHLHCSCWEHSFVHIKSFLEILDLLNCARIRYHKNHLIPFLHLVYSLGKNRARYPKLSHRFRSFKFLLNHLRQARIRFHFNILLLLLLIPPRPCIYSPVRFLSMGFQSFANIVLRVNLGARQELHIVQHVIDACIATIIIVHGWETVLDTAITATFSSS